MRLQFRGLRALALGATPVSGVFKTGQIDAFVAALRTYGLAEVGRADDKQVELVSPGRGNL